MREYGWEVGIVSANDQSVVDSAINSDMWRLDCKLNWLERLNKLEQLISEMQPDWISLQWVGFGYDQRGLPYPFIRGLARLRRGCRLHCFVHEIWLGEKPGLPMRQRCLGWMQQAFTRWMFRLLKPEIVHTSNRIYARALADNGIAARELRLPGNIPFVANSALPRDLENQLEGITPGLVVCLFGSLDAGWRPDDWLETLSEWCRIRQERIVVLISGPSGSGIPEWESAKKRFASDPNLRLIELGFRPASEISAVLQNCTVGATTKSHALLGKSGAFAAMAEHGLPVMALRSPVETCRSSVPEQESWSVPVLDWEHSERSSRLRWLDRAGVGELREKPFDGARILAREMDQELRRSAQSR